MQIGHSGRTRVEEIILAVVLLIFAVRTAMPTMVTVYGLYVVKVVFAAAIATPAAWLLLARTLPQRKHALLAVFITYFYCWVLSAVVDWPRFTATAAVFGLCAFAGYLYYLTREEIKWIQQQSSPSSLLDPASRDTSSNE